MIIANFSGDKISSNTTEAYQNYEKSRFGEKNNSRIEYSFQEAIFLARQGKMQVFIGKKAVDLSRLILKIKKIDKKIELKIMVYSDLRKRGYIVKSALKFGADFRVYEKGTQPGADHAKWLVHVTKDSDLILWHEFAAKNRVAHSTKKHLLIAVVDEESDISYYEISWLKP